MTEKQRVALHKIIGNLVQWQEHPSPAVRESAKAYSLEQIQEAIKKINGALADDDGFQAHKIIGQFYESKETGVMKALV